MIMMITHLTVAMQNVIFSLQCVQEHPYAALMENAINVDI